MSGCDHVTDVILNTHMQNERQGHNQVRDDNRN